MKSAGTKSTLPIILIFSACIITVHARDAWPTNTRTSLAKRIGLAKPDAEDPNSKPPEVAPIMQRVLQAAKRPAEPPVQAAPSPTTPRDAVPAVKTADFYLKDGRLIYGKLITEDRNKITVEQIEGSKIIVATYSKRDIDPRSIQTKTITESRYYQDLAEYFAGRTWDFEDDPDDFIQAIRCYERTKRLITGDSEMNRQRIAEIDRKIAQLTADRELWTKQVESRAKLKELEFQAEYETRLVQLEERLDARIKQIDQTLEKLNKTVTTVQENQQKLEQVIPAMEQDLRRRLDILGSDVEATRRMMDPFSFYGPYPYGYRRYRPRGY